MEDYGIEFNPETVLIHEESVVVPDSMEISDDHRQQVQHILQKDSICFGADIFEELLEYWTVNNYYEHSE